jgi:hypothetical protein
MSMTMRGTWPGGSITLQSTDRDLQEQALFISISRIFS